MRKTITMEAAQKSYDEIVDLFARGTTPAKILAFRPSRESQERVQYLLARNKTDELAEAEAAELDRFGELEHLMQLVKARAHLYAGQTT
jgi:ribose 1,5-bisphosphokinase PhnN